MKKRTKQSRKGKAISPELHKTLERAFAWHQLMVVAYRDKRLASATPRLMDELEDMHFSFADAVASAITALERKSPTGG